MRDFLKNLKLNEQNISMLLGIVVVLLVGSLLYNYFKSVNQPTDSGDTSSTADEQVQIPSGDQLPADYTVQEGDTLWSISEAAYGTGYNWVDIYAANREVIGNNSNNLLADTTLTLPDVEPKILETESQAEAQPSDAPSEPVQYQVQKGDNLWKILVTTCNNGYLWPQVAKANNLANAHLIEVGQTLTIACN